MSCTFNPEPFHLDLGEAEGGNAMARCRHLGAL